ncbi:putative T7SS-secreted protein [Mycetocola zhujimingii]|uniref:Putative T7SS secretion signal domain-containing protein n=1 Tax=Mycetocola zhujimingii TaxID=2079792 RepID=A0A2U1TB29_9MICO|nr:hypothetical protein [Mycetocola zhujimingii]PWC06105.1 hypothetical protein DF223_13125 [Mycetocola zhujimingii]
MADTEFQPLEGDDAVVSSKATHYLEIAHAITRSIASLKSLADTSQMTSKAIDAVRTSATSVAEDIAKAQERYEVTANALQTYAGKLKTAKSNADTAIASIGSAQSNVDAAETAKTTAQKAAEGDPTLPPTAVDDADSDLVAASSALSGYQQDWRDARTYKNNAAEEAVASIIGVTEGKKGDKLNDSLWDNVGSKIYEAFKNICKWAGILAIFFSWVPFLGQILMVLAAIGAILELVDSLVKAIGEGGSWMDVLGAAAGVALTFFGGALIKHLGKLAKSSVIMKSAAKVVGNPAALNRMKGTLGLKNTQSIAPTMMEAGARMRMGAKDIFFKEPFNAMFKLEKGLTKAELGDFKTMFKTIVTEPALGAIKFNKDTFTALRLAAQNPSILADPMTLSRLGLAATVHGAQSANAVLNFDVSSLESYAIGPIGDSINAGKDTVDVIESFFRR